MARGRPEIRSRVVCVAIRGDTRCGRATVMGHVCLGCTIGVGWSLGCVLQSCEDAVEGGLEANHLGLHDLGVRVIRIRSTMHK